MYALGDVGQIALLIDGAFPAGNKAVVGQGIFQDITDHCAREHVGGIVEVGQLIIDQLEGFAAVEIVGIDDGERRVNQMTAA